MGTDSVADPSDKGSGVFGLPVPFQEALDVVMIPKQEEVQGIWSQLLEDKPGFEARAAFKISVSQLANSAARVLMGVSPCGCRLVDCGADHLALIGI